MKIGIIGGTGLYDLPGIAWIGEARLETPFGAPSDVVFHGRLGSRDVFFLPRHGRGHRLLPSEINHRANIWAMKALEVDTVLGVSAVGSLRGDLHPRDILLPDQFIDRGKTAAAHTFFGEGLVAHIAFAEPVCPAVRAAAAAAAREALKESGRRVEDGGVYVQIEGPAFSTAAESRLYRAWGGDIVGMTVLGEARLCREAEICYACATLVTDYDAGVHTGDSVTVATLMEHVRANAEVARAMIGRFVASVGEARTCGCRDSLRDAVVTPWAEVPADVMQRLQPIVGRYAPPAKA